MKRCSIVLTALVMVLMSFGFAHGATEVVLDGGFPVTGHVGGDTVWVDSLVTWDIRFTYTPGDASAITGYSNGFEIWTIQSIANPATPGYFDTLTFDTFALGWENFMDGGVFFGPTPAGEAQDALGIDTVGFGGFNLFEPGILDGFDDTVIWIATTPRVAGDTLCIDSTWYRPNDWLWSTDGPLGNFPPDWGGPYCYHVYSPPAGDLQVDQTDLTFTVAQGVDSDTSTVHITSSTGAARAELDFEVFADESWIQFDTAGGNGPHDTVAATTPMDILVVADFTGLDTGAYTATVTVTSDDAGNSPVNIGVTGDYYTDVAIVTDNLPTEYALSQNYPNPFNPNTEIHFDIPARSHVSLVVYNVVGQKITTLVDEELMPNRYVVDWDGTTDDGTKVASGVYFYKLEADDFVETKKMMFLK